MRQADERERPRLVREEALAMHVLRGLDRAQDRQLGEAPGPVPRLAAVAAHAVRDGLLEGHVQAPDLGVLGHLADSPWLSTNNRIESMNAQLGTMLRDHRGLSTVRRAKACFWWLYMRTECPLPAAAILREMPRDADVGGLFAQAGGGKGERGGSRYGSGSDWNEFHMPTEFRR